VDRLGLQRQGRRNDLEKIKEFIFNNKNYLLIAIFGLVLKFLFLGERALHHDESLHAQYGKYFANSFTKGFYKYDPLLHGPLLYNLQAIWHWIVDPLYNSAVRFIPAFLGFIVSLSPLLFKSRISKKSLYFLILFLSISPTFTFWSRFLRHDMLVIFELVIALWLFHFRPKHWVFFLGLCAGAHFSTKENFFVHSVLLLGFYGSYAIALKKLLRPSLRDLAAFSIGFLIISLPLYTAWFQYWPGFLDGLYRKSLGYWINQHHVERIKGPFYFNALIISAYETWLIVALGIVLTFWAKLQKKKWLVLDCVAIVISLLISFFANTPFPIFVSNFLKIKNNVDIFFFITTVYFSLRFTFYFLSHKNFSLAFWSYATLSSFFTYSFLGEKVPWLAIYPTLSAVVFISLLLPKLSKFQTGVIFTSLILCLSKTIYINHIVPGSERELISQVHTSKEYESLLFKIREQLFQDDNAIKPRVLVLEDNGWPLSWYIWGIDGVDFKAHYSSYSQYDFIFDQMLNPALSSRLVNTHERQAIILRHYWWPNFGELSFKNWLKLVVLHQPWSKSGEYQVAVWVKRNSFFSE